MKNQKEKSRKWQTKNKTNRKMKNQKDVNRGYRKRAEEKQGRLSTNKQNVFLEGKQIFLKIKRPPPPPKKNKEEGFGPSHLTCPLNLQKAKEKTKQNRPKQ